MRGGMQTVAMVDNSYDFIYKCDVEPISSSNYDSFRDEYAFPRHNSSQLPKMITCAANDNTRMNEKNPKYSKRMIFSSIWLSTFLTNCTWCFMTYTRMVVEISLMLAHSGHLYGALYVRVTDSLVKRIVGLVVCLERRGIAPSEVTC